MDSDLSRQVAEAMGWRKCPFHNLRWIPPWETPCSVDYEGPSRSCYDVHPNLADAGDREAVIAWLNAKGCVVRIDHAPDGHTVIIWTKDDSQSTKGAQTRSTIEEAFGRAFLAAVGAQG